MQPWYVYRSVHTAETVTNAVLFTCAHVTACIAIFLWCMKIRLLMVMDNLTAHEISLKACEWNDSDYSDLKIKNDDGMRSLFFYSGTVSVLSVPIPICICIYEMAADAQANLPNAIFILVDDWGFADACFRCMLWRGDTPIFRPNQLYSKFCYYSNSYTGILTFQQLALQLQSSYACQSSDVMSRC